CDAARDESRTRSTYRRVEADPAALPARDRADHIRALIGRGLALQECRARRDPEIAAEQVREIGERLEPDAHVRPRSRGARDARAQSELQRFGVIGHATFQLGIALQARAKTDAAVGECELESMSCGIDLNEPISGLRVAR